MLVRLILTPLFVVGLGLLGGSSAVVAQTAPRALLLSSGPVWAQDDGTPSSDQPAAPDALAGPLFNGQAPTSCQSMPFDAPQDPNGRWTYDCNYSDGSFAMWRSETDWTLLLGGPAGQAGQYTPEGHAYLDGPEPGAPDATLTGRVPASTADLTTVKSGFAGQVLFPPSSLPPFAPLQVSLVQSSLQSGAVGLTGEPLLGVYPQSYAVFFTNASEASQRQFGVAGARVAGAISKQMYDDTAADFLRTYANCAPTAAYCARPNFPQCTGIPCTIQAEIFRGQTVKGSNALVRHWQDQHDWAWDITWFDSQAGVTYSLSTENGADPSGFDTSLSANNQAGAQQLAAVAEKLVPWTGT